MPALHLVQSFCVCCASGFTTQSTLQNPKGKTFKDQVFIFSLLSQFHFLESYEIWSEKTFSFLFTCSVFTLFPIFIQEKMTTENNKVVFCFHCFLYKLFKSGNKVKKKKKIFQTNQSLDSCFASQITILGCQESLIFNLLPWYCLGFVIFFLPSVIWIPRCWERASFITIFE